MLLSDANMQAFTDGAPVFDINGRLLALVNTSSVQSPLTEDATEGIRAFLERRQPAWRDR